MTTLVDQVMPKTIRKVQASAGMAAILSGGSAVALVPVLRDFAGFVIERLAPTWSDPAVLNIVEVLIIAPVVGLVAFLGTWAVGFWTRGRLGE